MRAGEAARRAGVSVETLRYYERRGLLPEPARMPGGHRRYDEDAIRFLRAIKDTQALGFTLAEIEDYLRVVRRGRAHPPGLPYLGPALRRLLEELPAPRDGLSGTERRALQAVASGSATPIDAFLAEQDLEPAPFLGDAWFFRALAVLGSGDARLVETRAGDPLPAAPPLGDAHAFARLPLRLTRSGEQVLAGRADRVALLGIDR